MDQTYATGLKRLCENSWTTADARAQTRVYTIAELDALANAPWSRPQWRWPSGLRAFLALLPRRLRPDSSPHGSGFPAPGHEPASTG